MGKQHEPLPADCIVVVVDHSMLWKFLTVSLKGGVLGKLIFHALY
jgi:hypothetical protein